MAHATARPLHEPRAMRSPLSIALAIAAAASLAACFDDNSPRFGPGTGLRGFGDEDAGPPAQLDVGKLRPRAPVDDAKQPDAGAPAGEGPPPTSSSSGSTGGGSTGGGSTGGGNPPPPSSSSSSSSSSSTGGAPPPPSSSSLTICDDGPTASQSVRYTKALNSSATLSGSWTAYDAYANVVATGTCVLVPPAAAEIQGYAYCSSYVPTAVRFAFVFSGDGLLTLQADGGGYVCP